MAILTVDDIPDNLKQGVDPALLKTMVDGLNARAVRVAPCLGDDPTDEQVAEAKLILLGAINRWVVAGEGAGGLTQQSAGPFSVSTDTRQRSGYGLWPSEITDLQALCGGTRSGKAFSVDTAPVGGGWHSIWCSLRLGGQYCSCGADIADGVPIYEGS